MAMKDETFTELLASANEALDHAQGKRNLRTTTLPLPPQPLNGRAVKRVRAALHASQAVFARYLNVSTKLVQAWEANRRRPGGRECAAQCRRFASDATIAEQATAGGGRLARTVAVWWQFAGMESPSRSR